VRIKTITIISIALAQIIGMSQVAGQCQCVKQLTFRQFSESYTQGGIEEYWLELYKSFDIPEDVRNAQMTGLIHFSVFIDNTGGLSLYFANPLQGEANKELRSVIIGSKKLFKENTNCLYITGLIAIESLEKHHQYKDGVIPDLIFTYVNPVSRD